MWHLSEEPACRLIDMNIMCVLAQFLVARFAWEFYLLWLFLLAVGPYSKAKTIVKEEGGMGAWKGPVPVWLQGN